MRYTFEWKAGNENYEEEEPFDGTLMLLLVDVNTLCCCFLNNPEVFMHQTPATKTTCSLLSLDRREGCKFRFSNYQKSERRFSPIDTPLDWQGVLIEESQKSKMVRS